MASFVEVLLLSTVMGFSIYLSLPILLRRKTGTTSIRLLNAIAVGILIFLVGDVFSDVAQVLYSPGSLYGYGSNPSYDVVFTVSLVLGFMVLYLFENRSRTGLTAAGLSLIIAIGIGFQNLTEGLVFGSLGVTIGLTGITLVVLLGFTLQNLTEGFPIASPFLGRDSWELRTMLTLFLVGGLPTVFGGAIGYYYHSVDFNLFFDGAAIGSILYAILPMFKVLMRDMDQAKQRAVYIGVFLGFVIGFLVNLI